MNMLEDSIVFLIWAAWVLFIFNLKQKQQFSVWSFPENVSFISFHGGNRSRYSDINKFKTRFFFAKWQKHTIMQVSKATSCIMRLFASLDIHYNNSPNTKVQKQNETKIKKLQTKVVGLNDFRDSLQCIFSIDIKLS